MILKKIRIQKWREFPIALEEARTLLRGSDPRAQVLFRGQADAKWELETTLERRTDASLTVIQYAQMAAKYSHEVQAVSGRAWDIPQFPDMRQEVMESQSESRLYLPSYPYLVYLRQHGFASPLLDWTKSPFIAAFFAMQPVRPTDGDASVFAFCPSPDNLQSGNALDPAIHVQGPYTQTHVRHFTQQAWYTISSQWDPTAETHRFVPHGVVFAQGKPRQDLLVQITIPRDQRLECLAGLAEQNINHYTLYQSEDSLIQSLDSRVFDLNEY